MIGAASPSTANDLRLKIGSFLPRRLFQLRRIRREAALKIALDSERRDRVAKAGRALHHVVAVKVVASEAALPKRFASEPRVRHVERIVLHLQFTVTVPAVSGLHRHTAPRMLAVAARALLGRKRLPNIGEARLVEAKGGMSIERPFVTSVAIVVRDLPQSEIDRRAAQSEKKTRTSLDLLPHGARRGTMTARALELLVPRVHFSGGSEILLPWCEQRERNRERQANPQGDPGSAPYARGRSAPIARTTRYGVSFDGDCREAVVLSFTAPFLRHDATAIEERFGIVTKKDMDARYRASHGRSAGLWLFSRRDPASVMVIFRSRPTV